MHIKTTRLGLSFGDLYMNCQHSESKHHHTQPAGFYTRAATLKRNLTNSIRAFKLLIPFSKVKVVGGGHMKINFMSIAYLYLSFDLVITQSGNTV